MKCTIQNIADHLGLSRNTVSKALKNSSEVSENTRNLVIKTASKLGYKNATFATPVIPASETGSNGTILFLTRTYASDSEFWTTVLRGIESILSNANYHLPPLNTYKSYFIRNYVQNVTPEFLQMHKLSA